MAQYSKETALDALTRVQESMIWNKKYFIAIIEDNLLEYYFERFVFKKENYSDELPKLRIGSAGTPQAYKTRCSHKCQANYIVGLRTTLGDLIRDDMIDDPNLMKKIKKYRSHRFKCVDGDFTTQEEIDLMNNILDDVISYLWVEYS